MNEWIELSKKSIPTDILDGEWEIQLNVDDEEWAMSGEALQVVLSNVDLHDGLFRYRVRRPQPKAPTNEEIMTKWWKLDHDNDGYWVTPIGYARGLYRVAYPSLENPVANVSRDWFIDRESADVPPEGN